MKRLLIQILLILSCQILYAQQYWQQKSNHTIHVTLDDSSHVLSAFETIDYTNNSPDTLTFIWFHLWPNAYKNDKTAFSEQLLKNGRTDFYFSDEGKRGYINRLDFSVNGRKAETVDHPQHQDIIKLLLPSPLLPGQSIKIETPFHVKLPAYFSRSGYIGKTFMVTQWFPKPAVYDQRGWHEMPYLDQGEFYSEFGNYDVYITLPEHYIVGATGEVIDTSKEGIFKTMHYAQDNVHDFAFFASADYISEEDTLQLTSKIIKVISYHFPGSKIWENSISYIKNAIRTKSEWIGEYPYNTAKVFEKPGEGFDGMEYPTITLIASPNTAAMLESVINHEVGHNWFYGILASNERDNPWMDEGMNSYYDKRYNQRLQEPSIFNDFDFLLKNKLPVNYDKLLIEAAAKTKRDVSISSKSQNISSFNYDIIIYRKAAAWMKQLEYFLGKDTFDLVMKTYFQAWKFKHPYPENFIKIAETVSNKNLTEIFSLLDKKGTLNEQHNKKDLKITAITSFKEREKHNYIGLLPAIGFNYYDKLMIGAFIHNYTLPIPSLTFFAAPLFATSPKKLEGMSNINYSIYPGQAGSKLDFFITGSYFSADMYRDSTGKKNYLPFSKIVPGIKFEFAPKEDMRNSIQWKTYLISETNLNFTRDATTGQDIISYPTKSRYINQLRICRENNRELYPYSKIFLAEQSNEFVRLNLTLNAFFNYKKEGGLNARFYAGKFIYLKNKTTGSYFQTDRYHLNMTGAKGYEDYTYSDYFIGRNEFEGIFSQQIMIRDGAFKIRTDLLSNKIGKTDDWLMALNLSSTIPKQLNPLEILPIKIPIKVFADLGTYADAWGKKPTTGNFLYDAGLQISLFGDIVNIYAPIIYSKEYRDYLKSTITGKRFWKTISFTIDFQKISLNKLLPKELY